MFQRTLNRIVSDLKIDEYDITLDKRYTVESFLSAVCTVYEKEWGYIGIERRCSLFGYPYVKYKNGEIVSGHFNSDIMKSEITSVKCTGKKERMDYILTIKRRK